MQVKRQRGISLIGLVIVIAILGGIGILAMKIVPTVTEYRAILGAIERAKHAGTSIKEIQESFQKSAEVGYISAISERDLVIQRVGGEFEISFEYEKKIPLVGPASILLEYNGTTAKNGPKTKGAE
jgi:type II secretory pathway pseudopilin PulG